MGEKLGGDDSAGKCGNRALFVGSMDSLIKFDVQVEINGASKETLEMNKIHKIENTLENSKQQGVKVTVNGETLDISDILSKGADNINKPEDVTVIVVAVDEVLPISTGNGSSIEVPIGQYSSSRLPGQMGTIKPGEEMNALDVAGELNYKYRSLNEKYSNWRQDISKALGMVALGAGVTVLVIITGGAALGMTVGAATAVIGEVSLLAGLFSFLFKPDKTVLDYLTIGHGAKVKMIGMYVKNNIFQFTYTAQGIILGEVSKLADERKSIDD